MQLVVRLLGPVCSTLMLISKWDEYNLSSLDLCCSPTGRYLEDDALNYTKHDELDDCTLCEANYYGPKEGAYQSSDCRACASGKFSAEGAESCVQCSSGTFQNQSTLNCDNCTRVRLSYLVVFMFHNG